MMAIHIPPDMIPRMDWNAEDKQAAWAFYRERLEKYFMIAGTPVFKAFANSFEKSSSHWQARDE